MKCKTCKRPIIPTGLVRYDKDVFVKKHYILDKQGTLGDL